MDLWQQQRRQPVQGDMYAERSLCGQRCNLAGINRIQNNRQCRSIERAKKSLQKIVQAGRRIHDERCNAYGNDCNDHTADSAYTDQPFVAELLFENAFMEL